MIRLALVALMLCMGVATPASTAQPLEIHPPCLAAFPHCDVPPSNPYLIQLPTL